MPCQWSLEYTDGVPCRELDPSPKKRKDPRYDREVWSTLSLLLLSGPLWPIRVVSVRISTKHQIDLF